MAVKVVDASALAAVLFDEPDAEAVAAELADAELTAPALLTTELANVCVVKVKRAPRDRAALLQAYRMRELFAVTLRSIEHDAVVELALRSGLTAYDACYLWLARHLGAPLVSLDKQLLRAATVF